MNKKEIKYEKNKKNMKLELIKNYIEETKQQSKKSKSKSKKEMSKNKNKSNSKDSKKDENEKIKDKETRKKKFEEDYKLILEMRKKKTAPVDTLGSSNCIKQKNIDFKIYKFQNLVSLLLSSQTKDDITYSTTQKLVEYGLTIDNMIKIPIEKLTEIIFKVSFHNNKAKSIKKLAEILRKKYNDNAPENLKEIIKLPGIGKKMGILYMKECLNKIEGIAVDTHIHKISNRLNWVNDTKNPEKTEVELEEICERKYWNNINTILVGFGQEICKSVSPLCDSCLLNKRCEFGKNVIMNKKSKEKEKDMKKRKE